MTDIHSLYHSLLLEVRDCGTPVGNNLVAFSGGVDSALVAHAVQHVYPENCVAVTGVSPSLSGAQRDKAREIARHIGITLLEVPTTEGEIPEYVENNGMSCYHCKHNLYSSMEAVDIVVQNSDTPLVLFNGSNADDLQDPTRVGLRAAGEHRVVSPLARFHKDEVRALSRHAMLPNWNDAASPCTRSRLALGVPATAENLARIESVEQELRERLQLPDSANFRVRHMEGDVAMIEVDAERLDEVQLDAYASFITGYGFSSVDKRAFRSGSVSGWREMDTLSADAAALAGVSTQQSRK